ncbi:MFS transporter [Candidatus Nomurabacteria bacterium]|nr:MFS transporter [Candidatus Nomurabacteria bacterium]
MNHNRKIIYLAGFLFSMPVALMLYINSSFLSTFVKEELMSLTYTLASIASIFGLLLAPTIFRKIGGHKFLLLVIAADALSILFFAFSKNAWSAIPVFIIGFTLNTLVVFSLDEILKIFSKDSKTGRIRGIYLSVVHLAFISSQLLLGITVLGHLPFQIIYIVAFGFMALFFLLAFFGLKDIPDPEYDNFKTFQYIKKFFGNKKLFRIYGINFLLQFFYAWMVIYTPIYLSVHLGFTWAEIGIIFAIMLTPFIIIPFRIGKYADRAGERKILMFGFLIAGVATLSLFFVQLHSVWIWAVLLFTTRIGAATIDVMSDAYFFKHIKPENEEFVGVYRSALPISFIIAPIVASLLFIFVPAFNFIYLILGAFMLYGIYLSSTIRKSDI